MGLAQKQAQARGLDLQVLNLVLQQYSDLNEPELGTQALIHSTQKR